MKAELYSISRTGLRLGIAYACGCLSEMALLLVLPRNWVWLAMAFAFLFITVFYSDMKRHADRRKPAQTIFTKDELKDIAKTGLRLSIAYVGLSFLIFLFRQILLAKCVWIGAWLSALLIVIVFHYTEQCADSKKRPIKSL